jgi:ADP-ribosylglycohydrolase
MGEIIPEQGFYGAVLGDICGSWWGYSCPGETDKICLLRDHSWFTANTVCIVAMLDALTTDGDCKKATRKWRRKYPEAAGVGRLQFIPYSKTYEGGPLGFWQEKDSYSSEDEPHPYCESAVDGGAVQVFPLSWKHAAPLEKVPEEIERAEIRKAYRHAKYWSGFLREVRESLRTVRRTWVMPDAYRSAEATASAVFMARLGVSKEQMRENLVHNYGYNLRRSIKDIHRTFYSYACEDARSNIPLALIAFLESADFASTLRNAISISRLAETSTIACIAGSIAEAYYREIPQELKDFARRKLPLEMQQVLGIAEEPFEESSAV